MDWGLSRSRIINLGLANGFGIGVWVQVRVQLF